MLSCPWRYAVTTNDNKRRDINLIALYVAALSVYETLLAGAPEFFIEEGN